MEKTNVRPTMVPSVKRQSEGGGFSYPSYLLPIHCPQVLKRGGTRVLTVVVVDERTQITPFCLGVFSEFGKETNLSP